MLSFVCPPEIPRGIAFIPSIIKRMQKWRVWSMTVATLLSGFNIFYLCHYRQPRHLPSEGNFERVGDYLY